MTEPLTQVEIADALGVSPGRVSQLEQAALRKCRKWLQAHGIGAADLLDGTDTPTNLRLGVGMPDTEEVHP